MRSCNVHITLLTKFPLKYSRHTQTENYYLNLLKLYLPHRSEKELKPDSYNTYEEFYLTGEVTINNDTIKVATVIQTKRAEFEPCAKEIDEVQELLENSEFDDNNPFGSVGPSSKIDKNVYSNMFKKYNNEEDDAPLFDEGNNISYGPGISVEMDTTKIDMSSKLKLLNDDQQKIFYFGF